MRRLTMVLLGVMTVGAAGCATLARQAFREPVVTLRDVKLVGVGLTGGTIDVVLSVYNPNEFRLDGTRVTYNVFADTVPLGSGALDQRFTVQEGDSALVTLPITFTYAGLGAAGSQIRNSGTLNYRVAGDITVGTPIGEIKRPYSQSGRYTLFGRDEH